MPKAPETATFSPEDLAKAGEFDLSDHLENGRIVFFPECPIDLPSPEDLNFLVHESSKYLKYKNISYYPRARKTNGMEAPRDLQDRMTRILREHQDRVQGFLDERMASLTPNWFPGTSSYRPIEEAGRDLDIRASNERIHVDAGAYGATHGSRIMRFFTNIHPDKPRVWKVKGTFPDLLQEFGSKAGITGDPVSPGLLDRMFSGMIRGLSVVVPMARSLDSSPYDRSMRRLHNYMKESEEFQSNTDGTRVIEFPAGCSWMVFTDMVGHSCISGQHALVNTFLIPRANCRRQELTPWEILLRHKTA